MPRLLLFLLLLLGGLACAAALAPAQAEAAPLPAPEAQPQPQPQPQRARRRRRHHRPSASPQASTSTPSPPPPPPPPLTGARSVPSPVVGVTLDRVDGKVLAGAVDALRRLKRFPTARVCFDPGSGPAAYARAVAELRNVSYVMGQILDSSEMKAVTVAQYRARAQAYVAALGGGVDVWEVGNEINAGWLGAHAFDKALAAYQVVAAAGGGRTALTFYYEGDPGGPNCLDGPSNDMFTWIEASFQLTQPAAQRDPSVEAMRLGLDYALISWYPTACPGVNPDWPGVYTKLAGIFPNSKVGFGELGTPKPQNGSPYEVGLIKAYYPSSAWTKAKGVPASYVGGYFWWYFAEEMVPYTKPLWGVLNAAI